MNVFRRYQTGIQPLLAGCLLALSTGGFVANAGQGTVSETNLQARAAARAEEAFRDAQQKFLANTNSAEAAWHFSRACFNRAVLAKDNSERAVLANRGIAAARQAIVLNPALAAGHYYLGVNLGQLADTKRNLAALRIVDEMEREFRATKQLDEHFSQAGGDRNLGLLYAQAPAIISIGSRSKARQHLQRAVELEPDFPENRLNLIEAYMGWGRRSDAVREFNALVKILPEARKKFAGMNWEVDWADWEKRVAAARKRLGIEESPQAGETAGE